jgi:hypothetical protein
MKTVILDNVISVVNHNNPDFNSVEFDGIKINDSLNLFIISIK